MWGGRGSIKTYAVYISQRFVLIRSSDLRNSRVSLACGRVAHNRVAFPAVALSEHRNCKPHSFQDGLHHEYRNCPR